MPGKGRIERIYICSLNLTIESINREPVKDSAQRRVVVGAAPGREVALAA